MNPSYEDLPYLLQAFLLKCTLNGSELSKGNRSLLLNGDNIMNKIIKIVALIALSLAVIAFLFMPSPLQYVAEFQEVFNNELPKGCVCVFQQLFVTGRDQAKYSYCGVIQGDKEVLKSLVYKIGLNEKNADEYEETQEMLRDGLKELYPIGVRQGITLQLFEKKKLNRYEPDWCYIQAEIIDNRLYIFKFASASTLRDSVAKRGGVLKLLWRKLTGKVE